MTSLPNNKKGKWGWGTSIYFFNKYYLFRNKIFKVNPEFEINYQNHLPVCRIWGVFYCVKVPPAANIEISVQTVSVEYSSPCLLQ